MLFVFSIVISFTPSSSALSEFPVITTSFGSIRGFEFTNNGGFTAQIFKKLPFAAPPVGPLRWAKPQPPPQWNQTIDGTFFGPACAQRTPLYDGPVTGFSEDCLHLNVFTSEQCRKFSCPVVFIIHGGLGIYEAPMRFPDKVLVDNFVSQGIVVVTTAYRLGVFGIMALGDENALPANLAVHDVLAALKFVRAEIHEFGGDKERITILGHSTGAQIALLLSFSPAISPPGEPRLFSGVISMSGASRLERMELQVERSQHVARQLNCTGSAQHIVACMRKKSSDEILDAEVIVTGGNAFNTIGLTGNVMGGELLPISSEKEMWENTGKPLRLMIGTTLHEFHIAGLEFMKEYSLVNPVLGIHNDHECFQKYLAEKRSGKFATKYETGSQSIFMTAHTFAKEVARSGGEAYLYQYEYPAHSKHTDDAHFVLGFYGFEKDANEHWLSRSYPRYFANFVKGTRPAPDWYQVKPALMNYYSINRNESSGVLPHMKFDYQHEIAYYYSAMMEYDRKLSALKREVLQMTLQYQ